MSHRRNDNSPGDAHELTFSCYRGLELLRAERTCRWFLDGLRLARKEHHFAVWAYVLMPNHVHVVIWPKNKRYDIAGMRQAIKSPCARSAIRYLEKNHPDWLVNLTRSRGKRVERLFWQSGGGYDRNVQSGKTLLAMIEYIHMNPVRKGLVERPADWPWSSAAAYEGGESPLTPDPIDACWLEGVD